jgi:hypothetical protein
MKSVGREHTGRGSGIRRSSNTWHTTLSEAIKRGPVGRVSQNRVALTENRRCVRDLQPEVGRVQAEGLFEHVEVVAGRPDHQHLVGARRLDGERRAGLGR